MNTKITARFKEPINTDKSTMFPVQIHEFEHENMYINTSVIQPFYLAVSLSSHGDKFVDYALKNYKNMAIFNTTSGVRSKAHVLSCFGKDPLIWYSFDPLDLPKIKASLRRKSKLLFKSGAIEIFLPILDSPPVYSVKEAKEIIDKAKAKDIEIVTVHIMASCPMGSDPATSVVNTNGELWNMRNVLVTDASILPSNFGQSPQGTVMAFVHEVMRRHLGNNENYEQKDLKKDGLNINKIKTG